MSKRVNSIIQHEKTPWADKVGLGEIATASVLRQNLFVEYVLVNPKARMRMYFFLLKVLRTGFRNDGMLAFGIFFHFFCKKMNALQYDYSRLKLTNQNAQ